MTIKDELNDYDIPDEEKPEQDDYDSTGDELLYDLQVRRDKITRLKRIRQQAYEALRHQDGMKREYGDEAASAYVRRFILNYMDDILGILKNIKDIQLDDDWYEDIDAHYALIKDFIEKATYAIHNYQSKIRKLEKR
jgi:hypothetical protein